MKCLLLGLMVIMMGLSGCSYFCPKCPPTVICPEPPKPREVLRPILDSPKMKEGTPASTVIKSLEDDLGKCLRYADELDTTLSGYK